jgi:hypothetical protein
MINCIVLLSLHLSPDARGCKMTRYEYQMPNVHHQSTAHPLFVKNSSQAALSA